MPTGNEKLRIEPVAAGWGVWIACGCDDETCTRHIAVEYRQVRQLGNALITIAQQQECAAERRQKGEETDPQWDWDHPITLRDDSEKGGTAG